MTLQKFLEWLSGFPDDLEWQCDPLSLCRLGKRTRWSGEFYQAYVQAGCPRLNREIKRIVHAIIEARRNAR